MKKRLGERIKQLFSRSRLDEAFFEELEDLLIEADIGAATTVEIVDSLRQLANEERLESYDQLKRALKRILSEYVIAETFPLNPDKPYIFLILGVNGVGKTTTIAKLANLYGESIGKDKVLIGAGDTFRAAAIDQLELHGKRLGIKVVAQAPGADPGAVIFDTIESARARGVGVVFADTAGRMHNKANLVKELQKIDKIVSNKAPDAVYRKILIIDATTGQNAFRQAELFHEAVKVDSAVLTKYDSSSKGGIAVSISKRLGIPFAFIGTGEKYQDIKIFSKDQYIESLLGDE